MKKPWFAVKRYGHGAGFPISWEGWLVLAGFLAFVVAVGLFLPLPAALTIILLATVAFIAVAHRRSNGDWRWRNGRE